MKQLEKIQPFIVGYKEWHEDITTSFNEPLINYYDLGRNLGEKIHNRRRTE